MTVPASAVSATARITAVPDGRGGTALPLFAGDGPLALRRVRGPAGPAVAEVAVVGAMAAPLGGDRLRITVEVAEGASLRVGSAAATVSLPGRGGAPAHYDLELRAGPGAQLDWRPEPLVAAARSHLLLTTRVELAAGADHLADDRPLRRLHRSGPADRPGSRRSRLGRPGRPGPASGLRPAAAGRLRFAAARPACRGGRG
ncbi:urease accessory protein UreD, partial [Streptacidiphilus griseoplanus]|uniref:urease accessory protein UreD n=1 Tax=Peterkaempfera griseoplana TaxID=66896 RepID=UPI0006E20AC1